ncbi:MAG: GNAT family N-acetyltransferase [Desulfosporosinus sp.]|nr:GNAT family N-acetyltransferase [Desulfosporosinus sp.]
MTIRKIQKKDATYFLDMLLRLDRETKNMMFEPDERPKDVKKVEDMIVQYQQTHSLILIANTDNDIVGFLSAEKGCYNRIKHTAYIVVGILPEYQGKSIGTNFLNKLEEWARQSKITRLELTVRIDNKGAVHLYKKNGFVIEGVKRKSMIVDGKYVDEYYMARIL